MKNGQKTLVQCKHWKQRKVGVQPVRELYGVVAAEKAAAGKVVVTGGFTEEAHEFAKKTTLELVDGAALWAAVVRMRAEEAGEQQGATRRVLLKALAGETTDEPAVNSGAEAVDEAEVHCPKCNAPMVKRMSKRK